MAVTSRVPFVDHRALSCLTEDTCSTHHYVCHFSANKSYFLYFDTHCIPIR